MRSFCVLFSIFLGLINPAEEQRTQNRAAAGLSNLEFRACSALLVREDKNNGSESRSKIQYWPAFQSSTLLLRCRRTLVHRPPLLLPPSPPPLPSLLCPQQLQSPPLLLSSPASSPCASTPRPVRPGRRSPVATSSSATGIAASTAAASSARPICPSITSNRDVWGAG